MSVAAGFLRWRTKCCDHNTRSKYHHPLYNRWKYAHHFHHRLIHHINISTTTILRARASAAHLPFPASLLRAIRILLMSLTHFLSFSILATRSQSLLNGNHFSPEMGIEFFDKTGALKTESYGEANNMEMIPGRIRQRGIDFISIDEYGLQLCMKDQFFTNTRVPNSNASSLKPVRVIISIRGHPGHPYSWGPANQLGSCHCVMRTYKILSQMRQRFHLDERSAHLYTYMNGQYWGRFMICAKKFDDKDFTNYYSTRTLPMLDAANLGGTWESYSPTGGRHKAMEYIRDFVTGNHMKPSLLTHNYVDSVYNVKSLTDYFVLMLTHFVSMAHLDTEWWRGLDTAGTHKKIGDMVCGMRRDFGHYITGEMSGPSISANVCDPQAWVIGRTRTRSDLELHCSPIHLSSICVFAFHDLSIPISSARTCSIVLDSIVTLMTPEMPAHISAGADQAAR